MAGALLLVVGEKIAAKKEESGSRARVETALSEIQSECERAEGIISVLFNESTPEERSLCIINPNRLPSFDVDLRSLVQESDIQRMHAEKNLGSGILSELNRVRPLYNQIHMAKMDSNRIKYGIQMNIRSYSIHSYLVSLSAICRSVGVEVWNHECEKAE